MVPTINFFFFLRHKGYRITQGANSMEIKVCISPPPQLQTLGILSTNAWETPGYDSRRHPDREESTCGQTSLTRRHSWHLPKDHLLQATSPTHPATPGRVPGNPSEMSCWTSSFLRAVTTMSLASGPGRDWINTCIRYINKMSTFANL